MPRDYDSNDNDPPSETESSDTHPSQGIHTPTSSTGMNPSSTVSGEDRHEAEWDAGMEQQEYTPLLSASGSVEDEKRQLIDSEAEAVEARSLNREDKDGVDSVLKGPLLPAPSAGAGAGAGAPHARCRRRRFRQVCLLVSVKVILLVGSLGWLGWFLGGVDLPNYHKYICPYQSHHDHSSLVDTTVNRNVTINNGPNAIAGKYPLYDELSLSTTSGNIGVTILPQPASRENPDAPAHLRIRTQAGGVTVSFAMPDAARLPEAEVEMELGELKREDEESTRERYGRKTKGTNRKNRCKKKHGNGRKKNTDNGKGSWTDDHDMGIDIPQRPYAIDVETTTGSIAGRFLFSSSARLVTNTGGITANLIPIIYETDRDSYSSSPVSKNVTVHTHTHAGSQQVRMTGPIMVKSGSSRSPISRSGSGSGSGSADPKSEAAPTGSHRTETGSIHIAYPRKWTGTAHGESRNGDVRVSGCGVSVSEGDGWVEGVRQCETEGKDCQGWPWGDMYVSLESEEGSVMFYAG